MSRANTPESAVLKSCLQLLRAWRIPAWRNNTGAMHNPAGRLVRFGVPGASDILGLLPFAGGRMIAIETKAPMGSWGLTNPQWEFLNAIHEAGGVAVVVSDVARLAELLAELQRDPEMDCPLPARPAMKVRSRSRKH